MKKLILNPLFLVKTIFFIASACYFISFFLNGGSSEPDALLAFAYLFCGLFLIRYGIQISDRYQWGFAGVAIQVALSALIVVPLLWGIWPFVNSFVFPIKSIVTEIFHTARVNFSPHYSEKVIIGFENLERIVLRLLDMTCAFILGVIINRIISGMSTKKET